MADPVSDFAFVIQSYVLQHLNFHSLKDLKELVSTIVYFEEGFVFKVILRKKKHLTLVNIKMACTKKRKREP